LECRERLPAPTLQRLLRRTGTLYRDTWNDFALDQRTAPVYIDKKGIVEVTKEEEEAIDA
jgi:hypothetical protein